MKSLLFLCLLVLTTVMWAGECPQPYRNVATAAQSVANGSAPAGYAVPKPHINMPKNGATAKQNAVTLLVMGVICSVIGAGLMIFLIAEFTAAIIFLLLGVLFSGIALIVSLVSINKKDTYNEFPEYLVVISAISAFFGALAIPISMVLGIFYSFNQTL